MQLKKALKFGILPLLFLSFTAIMAGQGRGSALVTASTAQRLSKPTLVIDAGHGGADGGAIAVNGKTESAINLSIALKTRELCRLFGIAPVMTRSSESLDYPPELRTIQKKKVWDQRTRAARVNAVPNALLLSIHQNKFPDARPFGTQVLYGASFGSREFAELTHDNLIRYLCPENRRVAAPIPKRVYLFQKIQCPAILVECGFLSNPAEAEKLIFPTYQSTIAVILLTSYLQYIG